jgi:hypothetical protein
MHGGTFFAAVRCLAARYLARQRPAGVSAGTRTKTGEPNGRTMSRSNVLYLVVGALVVAVAVLGYYQYQDHDHNKKQTSGLNINVGPAGIHVGGGSK